MENFDTLRSSNSDDVMKYLGEVMNRLSQIESENSLKDRQLYNYDLEVKRLQQENLNLKNQINYYKQIEATLNNSMNMIRSTGEQIRNNALKEREVIIVDAKNNASRILNDALIKAEKVDSGAPIIVLVIGESFNKYHSSLYGYDLKTNPLLEKRLENKELAVFKDVVSPSNGTNYMMEYVFSLKSCDRQDDAKRNILFPAVFRKAGYRVGYFDNQYTQTSGGNYDFTCCYFLNTHKISNACFDYRNDTLMNYDGPFIDYYKSKFYRQPRSMNIIHLYGQHLDPRFRFPEDFASFSAKNIKRNDLDVIGLALNDRNRLIRVVLLDDDLLGVGHILIRGIIDRITRNT